ncbi:DASS family sodium-coupled anion symporter [Flavobacterium piscinae]|uniref:DASS family sodium-coupled anion symporter n=2 Tax=Flavobacterium piscinae TaxID=2506424 RepID=A0A4Q1KN61_9FLAO|nr:DASS family sodium-coupled anion symporter [Flavobacterium piscinae]RXR30649.1 DASS family sodium-coupled anion symporter [Flavobacterium piscinae]
MSDSRNYSIKQLTKIQLKVARQSRTILFLFSAVTSMLLVLLLRDPSFTDTQNYVMFLLFFSIGLWVTEAIPPFAVGILIVGFMVFIVGQENSMDAKRYVQTWSDGVIWLFLGGFFLAEGMKKTKLDFLLLKLAAPKFGSQAQYITLGLMMTTATISMLMSNTATTAMMIATVTPLFTQLGKDSRISKVLLLGIPAAASIGGMGTIIGSAPNAIAVGALEGIGIKITFIEWMIIGIPVAFLLTLMFWKILVIKYEIKKENLSLDFLQNDSPLEEEYAEEDKIRKRIVLIVMATTLALWLTSQWTKIPVAAVSGLPIVALTMLGIIDADDVRSLPWDTLMLVAGGLALGIAIQEQGLADYFISTISSVQINFYLLLLLFSITTVTLSNFMSNTAATTILIPVGISMLSITEGIDPIILPFVIGLSASCALLLPVSTPPNAIAYSTGLIKQSEFRIGGLFVGLVGPILIITFTLLYAMLK